MDDSPPPIEPTPRARAPRRPHPESQPSSPGDGPPPGGGASSGGAPPATVAGAADAYRVLTEAWAAYLHGLQKAYKGSLERLAAAWAALQQEVQKLSASYYDAVAEIWTTYLKTAGVGGEDQTALEQARAAGDEYTATLKEAAGRYEERLGDSRAHLARVNATIAVGEDPSPHIEKLRELWATGPAEDALEERKVAWLGALASYYTAGMKRMAEANAQIESDFKRLSADPRYGSWWAKALGDYRDALTRNEATVHDEVRAAAEAASEIVRRAYPQPPGR